MIQIPTGRPGEVQRVLPHNPYQYWSDYFQRNDESPKLLLETVELLRQNGKFDDLDRNKYRQYWMYSMLVPAIERRKGSPEEVKTILGFAAVLALQTKTPNSLLSVADMLHRRGIYDKVGPANSQTTAGELIDLTSKQIPHRIEPLMLSILVANKTKDPIRMGDTADKILSMGWPGVDEPMRRDTRAQVEALAKTLREDGREKEAEALLARLPASLSRDVYVRLSWEGIDDIDLLVEEPLGATAQLFKMPRTIFGGAIVSNGFGKHPQEIYVCPRGFSGSYTIRVDKVYQPENNPAKIVNLEIITHEGTPEEKRETRTVDLAKPEPVVLKLENGRRKEVLPFIAPPPESTNNDKPAPVVPEQAKTRPETRPGAKTGAAIKP